MTCCPLITQTLKIISVRCIPLNLRSKTQRRATLLLPTWIYSCQSVGTVNFTLLCYLSLLANRGRLLIRTPGPVPFGTCICSNVETILSWTCHVYGPFEFRTSLGTSILLPFTTNVTILISILQTFQFLSSNIPSSPAFGVFISQLIRYARASSSYECFILRAVRLSNKLLGQGYVKERLRSSLRKFYGRYGILSNNMRSPSPECYTTFWMMTIYSDTLYWSGITRIFEPITDLDLITEFDFLPNCERFP